jgi:hypothetical protein
MKLIIDFKNFVNVSKSRVHVIQKTHGCHYKEHVFHAALGSTHVNTRCEKNTEPLKVKAGGTYTNHCASLVNV